MTAESRSLRQDLIVRAAAWADSAGVPSYRSPTGVVFFEPYFFPDGSAAHGNFHPDSYHAITQSPHWRSRLDKPHNRAPQSHPAARETDSCTSSDALLMNLVCHPGDWVSSALGGKGVVELGIGGGVPITVNGGVVADRTELDLVVRGDRGKVELIIEAKLTESDFTAKSREAVLTYVGVDRVFDRSLLASDPVEDYQLIRNVLAAAYHDARFVLACDARRPDLVSCYERVKAAITDRGLARRCQVVTWQELASNCAEDLQVFLQLKYGINATG